MKVTKIFVLNTGGTLGMTGNPLRPAKSAAELLEGINIPKRLDLTLEDFPERQDSTNVDNDNRIGFARAIDAAYDVHHAFVILHGTDSLAETCAALSMIFKRSLQKPVFVIGAQMTKDECGSDVPMQIGNAMKVAKAFVRHGIVGVYSVCLGDVLDGSRVRKRRESDFHAFYTPGREPVAQSWPHVLFRSGLRKFDGVLDVQGLRLDDKFEKHVASLRVSADTPPWALMDAVKGGRLKGAILECKGAGQIPDRKWQDGENGSYSWIDAIQTATDKGIHVGIISPFEDGRVILKRYELGEMVEKAGGISLESLTPDMAEVKFRQAIAMHPKDPARIKQFIATDIVGELLPGFEDLGDEEE